MNIQEALKNIGCAIRKGLQEIDSDFIIDPEQIEAFPVHLPQCTHSEFLHITWEGTGFGHPSGMWNNRVLTSKTITCLECGGSVVEKLK